jgi:hypothetical protein
VAVIDRWLAETGQRPRAGALNLTPMSDPGDAAAGAASGKHIEGHRCTRRTALSRLVVPGAGAGDAQQPCERVEVLWPRCRGLDLITSSRSGQLDRDSADRLRTVLGTAQRPRRTRRRSLMIEAAIETPTYDLTVFKLYFGRLDRQGLHQR